MPGTKFPCLTIFFLKKEALSQLWSVQGAFQRNQQQNWGFYFEKERERKNMNGYKVANSCHHVTWAQKKMTKKRELE